MRAHSPRCDNFISAKYRTTSFWGGFPSLVLHLSRRTFRAYATPTVPARDHRRHGPILRLRATVLIVSPVTWLSSTHRVVQKFKACIALAGIIWKCCQIWYDQVRLFVVPCFCTCPRLSSRSFAACVNADGPRARRRATRAYPGASCDSLGRLSGAVWWGENPPRYAEVFSKACHGCVRDNESRLPRGIPRNFRKRKKFPEGTRPVLYRRCAPCSPTEILRTRARPTGTGDRVYWAWCRDAMFSALSCAGVLCLVS